MQLSSDQLAFLARFSKSPDGRALLQILEAKLAEVEVHLRRQDGAELHRSQGRAIQLDELMADIGDAQTRLARNAASVPRSTRHVAQ